MFVVICKAVARRIVIHAARFEWAGRSTHIILRNVIRQVSEDMKRNYILQAIND